METMVGSVTSTMGNIAFMLSLKGSTMKRKTERYKVSAFFGADV